jgi:hypothetical protein
MSDTQQHITNTYAARILDATTGGRSVILISGGSTGDVLVLQEDGTYLPETLPDVAKIYIQVALSANGSAIAAGTGKGFAPVTTAGTITAFTIDCDPNNEPSDQSTLVDLNKVARDTGVVTSVLSSVATIATGANTATGTIDGTQAVSVGDLLQFDVDQGSDGQDLIATVEITPS